MATEISEKSAASLSADQLAELFESWLARFPAPPGLQPETCDPNHGTHMFEVIRRIGDGTAATVHRNYLRRAAELLRRPTVRWRRGGATPNPEIPIVGGERFTEIFTASVGIDSCLFERRSLGEQWKPGGKWWKQCKWWCYRDDLTGTLPVETKEPT